MHVSSVSFTHPFCFPSGLSLSCVHSVFLLSEFKYLKNPCIGYAFNRFFFFFLNLHCSVLVDDKAAQAGASSRAACLCHDSAGCKRKECFLFWERVGEKGEARVTGMCVYLTSWCFCDFSRSIMLSCSHVGVNNMFQKKGLKDTWWKNGFA